MVLAHDHRPVGQRRGFSGPGQSVVGADHAAAGSQPLRCEHLVQAVGAGRLVEAQRAAHRVAIVPVGVTPAHPTGPMSRSQGNSVVEEEQRCPVTRLVER